MAKTVEQLKAEFATEGKTFVSWANERGYDPTYVSRIINGSVQAKYGKAHKIAIELGLIDNNSSCDEVDLDICSTDLTQMEQWFLSIYRSLNDEDRSTIERLLSLMDLENSWGDGDER